MGTMFPLIAVDRGWFLSCHGEVQGRRGVWQTSGRLGSGGEVNKADRSQEVICPIH